MSKLMNVGFWRFSRHPNYFGDFLIYISFGLISGSIWGLISPMTNFMQYMFDAIPKNEEMSAERYGVVWEDYKKRVKCMIPFVLLTNALNGFLIQKAIEQHPTSTRKRTYHSLV